MQLYRLQNRKLVEVKTEVCFACDPNHKPMQFVEHGFVACISIKPLSLVCCRDYVLISNQFLS